MFEGSPLFNLMKNVDFSPIKTADQQLGSLLEGLTNWQFEQAEAMTNYFTHQRNVKNETVYHILLANMKRMSISEFVEKKEIIVN